MGLFGVCLRGCICIIVVEDAVYLSTHRLVIVSMAINRSCCCLALERSPWSNGYGSPPLTVAVAAITAISTIEATTSVASSIGQY